MESTMSGAFVSNNVSLRANRERDTGPKMKKLQGNVSLCVTRVSEDKCENPMCLIHELEVIDASRGQNTGRHEQTRMIYK